MHSANVKLEALVEAGLARYRNADRPNDGVYAMFRNRLIIPIRNAQGRVVAFGEGRMPSDNSSPAKYVNLLRHPSIKNLKLYLACLLREGLFSEKVA